MLDTKIIELTYDLKELLINSEEYKDVKEKEKLMEENCSDLLIKYNYLVNEYNSAIRFEKYGSDVNKARKELADFKLILDTNEYVKSYNEAYKRMNKLLAKLEAIIFEGIKEDTKIKLD